MTSATEVIHLDGNSLWITQYTAAALATENKILAHPASVDTIPTSANVEDHVSMGNTAALKARQVLDNVEHILAIELLAAAQGVDFRREELGEHARLGERTAPVYGLVREKAPFITSDTIMYTYIDQVKSLIVSGQIDEALAEGMQPMKKIDLSEPHRFLAECQTLNIFWLNITAGSPYYVPPIQRLALFPPSDGYQPPEDPHVGEARLISAEACSCHLGRQAALEKKISTCLLRLPY